MRAPLCFINNVTITAVVVALSAASPRSAKAEDEPAPPAPAAPSPGPAAFPPPQLAPPLRYVPPAPAGYVPVETHRGLVGDARYRSPGLAVALSLQPLPIDFGNLYAENLGWGIAYTAAEVALMAPGMWLTGQHMDHGGAGNQHWSGGESGIMIGSVAGYVVVKLVAGVHAGYAAQAFNRAAAGQGVAFVTPTPGGALLGWAAKL